MISKKSKEFEIKLENNSKIRPSTKLTIKLLEDINKSIRAFKPSSSLATLASFNGSYSSLKTLNSDHDFIPHAEIDIVISGGGLKGYFMAGCSAILLSELRKNKIKIARISGASAGAWAAMFMICGVSTSTWMETYHSCKENQNKLIHDVYEDVYRKNAEMLPPDAYKLCSGRLFISITVLTVTGPKNRIISDFMSNEDLLQCCFASSTIPYLTERHGLRRFRGELVCDGGVTNNCPVFPDGVRRQLVFRLFEVEYPFRMLVHAQDTCIDALVIRGALLMARFLEGEPTDSIAWLERKALKSSLAVRPNYYLRLAFVPFAVGGLMFYRGTGLTNLFETMKSVFGNHITSIIPFEEAHKYLGNTPVRYVLGALLASLLDSLASMNLLL